MCTLLPWQVIWLLDKGLELEARDKEGVTPLHCAVFYMQRTVIKVLLNRGADISTKDDQVLPTPMKTVTSCQNSYSTAQQKTYIAMQPSFLSIVAAHRGQGYG